MDVIGGMEHLEVLNLYRTRVTNTGLAKLQNLKGLVDLDVRYSRVTSNGLESVRAALPRARVEFAGNAKPPSRFMQRSARPLIPRTQLLHGSSLSGARRNQLTDTFRQ